MPAPRPASPLAVGIAYALVCVVWGSTYLFIDLGVEVLPPYLLGGARFSIAGAVLVAVCLATGRQLPRDPRTFAEAAFVGVLYLVLGNGILNTAQQDLSSGLAALLVTTFPIWTTLLARFGPEGERLAPAGWAGLVVALAGVALLVRPFEGVESTPRGVILALVASFFWAVATVRARRRLRGIDPFGASAVETIVAGPLMLAVHYALGSDQPVEWGGQAWLAVGYLSLVGSLVGFTAFAFLTAHMSSSKVGTYAYVNPVVAVLLGWWILDEAVTWRLAIGGGTILAGLLLVYVARVRDRPAGAGPPAEAEPATPKKG